MLCTPGQSTACACENGLDGAQVCADDGMAFGTCMCEEPTPACTPGEMDACVCDGQELGMRECGDDSVYGECVCENDTANGGHVPGTQWVLRDKDGNAVPAVFEPVCTGENVQDCSILMDESTYPCILVKYLNGVPIWTLYNLSSGKPEACYPNIETWNEASNTSEGGLIYDNENCSGVPFVIDGLWRESKRIKIGGTLYYVDLNKPTQDVSPWFQYSNGCIETENKFSIGVRQVEPVPSSVTSLFDANAPYTINLE